MNRFRKGWNTKTVRLSLLMGLVLSGFSAYHYNDMAIERVVMGFHREAENQADALKKQIEVNLSILLTTVGFFKASKFVDRNEFETFTQTAYIVARGLKALKWVPRVTNSLRAEFEEEGRSQGMPEFHFTEFKDGKLVTAGKRKEYFPVFYLESKAVNHALPGFDLGSEELYRAMLGKACDSGQIMMIFTRNFKDKENSK